MYHTDSDIALAEYVELLAEQHAQFDRYGDITADDANARRRAVIKCALWCASAGSGSAIE